MSISWSFWAKFDHCRNLKKLVSEISQPYKKTPQWIPKKTLVDIDESKIANPSSSAQPSCSGEAPYNSDSTVTAIAHSAKGKNVLVEDSLFNEFEQSIQEGLKDPLNEEVKEIPIISNKPVKIQLPRKTRQASVGVAKLVSKVAQRKRKKQESKAKLKMWPVLHLLQKNGCLSNNNLLTKHPPG